MKSLVNRFVKMGFVCVAKQKGFMRLVVRVLHLKLKFSTMNRSADAVEGFAALFDEMLRF